MAFDLQNLYLLLRTIKSGGTEWIKKEFNRHYYRLFIRLYFKRVARNSLNTTVDPVALVIKCYPRLHNCKTASFNIVECEYLVSNFGGKQERANIYT